MLALNFVQLAAWQVGNFHLAGDLYPRGRKSLNFWQTGRGVCFRRGTLGMMRFLLRFGFTFEISTVNGYLSPDCQSPHF